MDIYQHQHLSSPVQTKPPQPPLTFLGQHSAQGHRQTNDFLSLSLSDDCLSQSVIQAVQQKHYHRALQLLDQLVIRHPHKASYYSNRGLVHLWMGHLPKALDDCTQAVRLAPELDQAYNNRATCYAAIGNANHALADYERAIDLNPFNTRARINLGVTLRDLGQLEAALTCFDDALLFYQLPEFVYAERGRTYHQRGDWNCAIADYRRTLTTIAEQEQTQATSQLSQRVQSWMAELLSPAESGSVN